MLKLRTIASGLSLIGCLLAPPLAQAADEPAPARRITMADTWEQWTGGRNLARGLEVSLFPRPNYKLTEVGGSDRKDLTDGVIMADAIRLWFHREAVGWGYTGGDIYLVIDLQKPQTVGGVVLRAQTGSFSRDPSWPSMAPKAMDVALSRDGQSFHHVARIEEAAGSTLPPRMTYELARENDVAVLHIENIDCEARYVAVRLESGVNAMVLDELAVMEGDRPARSLESYPPMEVLYNHGALINFEDPAFPAAAGHFLPVQFRVEHGALIEQGAQVAYFFDLPEDLALHEENFWGYEVREHDAPAGRRLYSLSKKAVADRRSDELQFFVIGNPDAVGQTGEMRYWAQWAGGKQTPRTLPVEVVPIDPVRVSDRLYIVEWLGGHQLAQWPDVLDVYERLGFNTVLDMPRRIQTSDVKNKEPEYDQMRRQLAEARARGFHLAFQDSPIHPMTHPAVRHPDYQDALMVGKDGRPAGVGYKSISPVYFGPAYEHEMDRIAQAAQLFGHPADLVFWDCEVNIYPDLFENDMRSVQFAKERGWGFEELSHYVWKKRHIDFYEAFMRGYRAAGHENTPLFFEYGINLHHDREKSMPVSAFREVYPKYLVGNPKLYGQDHAGDLHMAHRILQDFKEDPTFINVPYIQMGATGYTPSKRVRDVLAYLLGAGCRGVIYWGNRYAYTPQRLLYHRDAMAAMEGLADITLDGDFFWKQGANDLNVFGRRLGDEGVLIVSQLYPKKVGNQVTVQVPDIKGMYLTDLFAKNAQPQTSDGTLEVSFEDGFWTRAFFFSKDPGTLQQRRSAEEAR